MGGRGSSGRSSSGGEAKPRPTGGGGSIGEKWSRARAGRRPSVDSRVDVAAEEKWQSEVEKGAAKSPAHIVEALVAGRGRPQRVSHAEGDEAARTAQPAGVDRAQAQQARRTIEPRR